LLAGGSAFEEEFPASGLSVMTARVLWLVNLIEDSRLRECATVDKETVGFGEAEG